MQFSMTVIAGVLSLVFFGKLQGVREGTIVAAVLVGFIARFLGRRLAFLPDRIYGTAKEKAACTSVVDEGNTAF